jgi:Flp pilus assembly protein TadD
MTMLGTGASRLWLCPAIALIATGLAACQTLGVASSDVAADDIAMSAAMPEPADLTYVPSSEPLRLGLEHFGRGNYGLAQRYFRDAVEKSPKDADAWIGLAASYDHLRRFDLADQAYRAAIRLSGESVQVLNNQGYSYMLRGDLNAARAKFRKAYQREPHNPTIINNIQILDAQDQSRQRSH